VSIGLMLVLFFVFMVLGMPIAYCMGLAAILTVLADGNSTIRSTISRCLRCRCSSSPAN
jgi:hypothetical protein